MIRRIQFNISYANRCKLDQLDTLFSESIKVVNLYIDQLWEDNNFSSKFVNFKVDTWLTARLQQCLGKQALEIVKSQRKRRKKTKPVFRREVLNLDSRFVDLSFDINSFDVWFKLSSLGNRMNLVLPSRKHKHFASLINNGFSLKKSCRLRKANDKYFIDVYVEKSAPEKKQEGLTVGFDCGYRNLLVDSDGAVYDEGMELVYEKITRKKQGSNGFKRALVERDNLINQTINLINIEEVNIVVVEDLKHVKTKSRGRINKSFNNKLQRWSYPKVLGKMSRICEEGGVDFIKINPAYTSQTCNVCGYIDKKSRNGRTFICTACGYRADSDFNAAVNIRNRGIYSSSATKTKKL